MKLADVLKKWDQGIPLFWNDPDPIEGRNYEILRIWDFTEYSCMIEYGSDFSDRSTAEVFYEEIVCSELAVPKKVVYYCVFGDNRARIFNSYTLSRYLTKEIVIPKMYYESTGNLKRAIASYINKKVNHRFELILLNRP